MKVKSISRVRLLATTWTRAYQAPPAMGFSRQEYWSGVPLPSPTYLLGQLKWFILCLVFLKRLWVLGLPCLSISVFVPCLCLKAGMIISFLLFTTVLSVPLTLITIIMIHLIILIIFTPLGKSSREWETSESDLLSIIPSRLSSDIL